MWRCEMQSILASSLNKLRNVGMKIHIDLDQHATALRQLFNPRKQGIAKVCVNVINIFKNMLMWEF